MDKFVISGQNAIEIGHFKSYMKADEVLSRTKTPSFADKEEVLRTVEKVCNWLQQEGITKIEAKQLIEELKTHPRANMLKRKDQIIDILQTIVKEAK